MRPEFQRCSLLLFLALALLGCGREEPKLSTSSGPALQAYKEGVSQFEKFYYNEAKASFEEALRQDSTFAMAWLRLAMVQANTETEAIARQTAARAKALAPRTSAHEQLFIRMWYNLLHYDNEAAGRVADSLLKQYPDDKETYVFRGILYERSKNLDAAIEMYQKAIDTDTSYAMAVMSLGYAFSSRGEQERALGQMERYIRLAPDAADPRASYADLLLRAGRYDEALAQYRKSLELKTDYWYSFRMIGEIMLVKGQLKAAEENYMRSIDLLPPSARQSATRYILQARVNLQRGAYEAAAEEYVASVQVDTTQPIGSFGYVYALAKLKRFDEANGVVHRIADELQKRNLTQSTSMASFHLIRAQLLMEEGLLDSALQACDEALSFSTALSRAPISRQRAEILMRRRAFDEALDACSDALSFNPNAPEVLLSLVRIYHGMGDRTMMRSIGERLLEFWKDADPDFLYLSEVRRLLGSPQPKV